MRTKHHYKVILKQIGGILILISLINLIPICVGLIYKEWYSILGFFISALVIFSIGIFLYRNYKSSIEPEFNHAMIIAATAWFVCIIMGGLPLFIIAHITPAEILQAYIPLGENYTSSIINFQNPLHCIFESMSAYTTTGLTMGEHEPSLGKTILFYRSLAQWIGGAGFIVLSIAIIKHTPGRSLKFLYKSESTGINLRIRIRDTAKGLWKSYLIITLLTTVYLVIGTYLILPDYPLASNVFDSINHALCGLSSGGFSTLDNSIADYHSAAMEYLYMLPMILGSFSLPFYFRIFYKKAFSEFWHDIQTRALLICFIVGGIGLSLLLLYSKSNLSPFKDGVFQYISAISTTGWQTCDIHSWDNKSILFITFAAMFIGGAWGGTVGGIKIYRAVFIQKGIFWQIKRTFFSPNTILTMRFDGKTLNQNEVNSEIANVASFILLFGFILFSSTFLSLFLIPENYSFFDAIFESCAAQSTAGLSVGITNPSMSPSLEIIYILQMWIGRLEIIPVFALFRAIFKGVSQYN